jgi:hypothetical protein
MLIQVAHCWKIYNHSALQGDALNGAMSLPFQELLRYATVNCGKKKRVITQQNFIPTMIILRFIEKRSRSGRGLNTDKRIQQAYKYYVVGHYPSPCIYLDAGIV